MGPQFDEIVTGFIFREDETVRSSIKSENPDCAAIGARPAALTSFPFELHNLTSWLGH